MTDIRTRYNDGAGALPLLAWDTVWNPATLSGDWALAGFSGVNAGGLLAQAPLQTAVVLALFTDRRCPDNHPLAALAGSDKRGWWGDGIDVREDLGEAPLGSLLWLLERAPLTDDTATWARSMALDALQPLVKGGVVAKTVVTTEVADHRLNMLVQLYARDGTLAYAQQFDNLWRQIG